MPPSFNGKKQDYVVCGDKLLQVMQTKNLDEVMLAARAGVSDQTIRNYAGSTAQKPWPASLKCVEKICRALEVSLEDLRQPLQEGVDENAATAPACSSDQLSLSLAPTVSSPTSLWLPTGRWEICLCAPHPTSEFPWTLTKAVEFQFAGGPSIGFCVTVGTGTQVAEWTFSGNLSEGGLTISGSYSFREPDGKPKHGYVIAMRLSSNEIRGRFVGRNADFQPDGIIVGELTAARIDDGLTESPTV